MNIPKAQSALVPKSDLPWSTRDALIRFVFYYGLILVFLLILQLGAYNIIANSNSSINPFIIAAAINGIVGLVLSFVFLSFDGKKFSVLGLAYHKQIILLAFIAIITTVIALAIAYIIEIYGGVVKASELSTKRFKIENLSNLNIFVSYFFIFLMTFFGISLGEEIMFRGYILNIIESQSGFLKAAIVSSVLFGFLHSFLRLSGTQDVLNGMIAVGVSALIFGFVFAYAYKISGNNLVLPILIHGIWDAIIFFFNNDYYYSKLINVIFEIFSQLVAAIVLILLLFALSKVFSFQNSN